jgi:NAD-dependent deacetylase
MTIDVLVDLLRRSRPFVALTGAGVSTESGIPDFRSPSGIWAQYDPLEVASIDAWRCNPSKVWEFYARRLDVLGAAAPNPTHVALAELERAGWVNAVITQNIDGLHQAAGSQDVIEVHGSIRSAVCLACGRREPMEQTRARLPLPTCVACGAPLKPDVVMFGELLDAALIERATSLARETRCLLVIGSSLEVWPVAGLPGDALRAGGRLAIVNRDRTPYDDDAQVVVHAAAGETLAAVASALL